MFGDDADLGNASDFLKPKNDVQDDDALDLGDKKRAEEARARALAAAAKGSLRSTDRHSEDSGVSWKPLPNVFVHAGGVGGDGSCLVK